MVLGEKLKLEMFAPSLNHYRREQRIKHNVIFFSFLFVFHRGCRQKVPQKKKGDCFPADAQSADPLQQQPLVCGVNARERTHHSFCHFKLKPTLYGCGAGGSFTVYESVTLKGSSSPASRKNNDDKAECLIKKHNNNNFFKSVSLNKTVVNNLQSAKLQSYQDEEEQERRQDECGEGVGDHRRWLLLRFPE